MLMVATLALQAIREPGGPARTRVRGSRASDLPRLSSGLPLGADGWYITPAEMA